ncbi:hypothetical protein [Absidia glauca]|uniref:Uncharacterized protein n=1 Tax=Absidia glauca TaxID=4829 RepID=A0A168QR93_ABSGL|nr:hypothetical protein [Absidia glauca]
MTSLILPCDSLFIHSVGPYYRDSSTDAHFERRLTDSASSFPRESGLYGYLNVVLLPYTDSVTKLVIGTRTCNMLVTSSLRLDIESVNMGPGTTHFSPTSATRIFLDKESIELAAEILEGVNTSKSQVMPVIYQLEQVRSKFDHMSTYTLCRSSSRLASSLERQPASIWSLCEHEDSTNPKVPGQNRFRGA